jgi:hypothetical protein
MADNTPTTQTGKVYATYAEAQEAYETRTDWAQLESVECAFEMCGQKFRREVVGQTECRDCLACDCTGFYEGEEN